MTRKRICMLTMVFIVMFSMTGLIAYGAVPPTGMDNVTNKMLKADFWIGLRENPDNLVMDDQEIAAFNAKNIEKQPGLFMNFPDYPVSIDGRQLTRYLEAASFPQSNRYIGTEKVSRTYYNDLRQQMNLSEVKSSNKVKFAFTVVRTDMRTFPTHDVSLEAPDDWEFDMFQETAVGAAEPIVVLHIDKSGDWYYVQSWNCRGWIPTEDVAIAENKEIWDSYITAKDFLVVTGNRLILGEDPVSPELTGVAYSMGTRLPLVDIDKLPWLVENQVPFQSYAIQVPTRETNGSLLLKTILIPYNSDVSVGLLPYTEANLYRLMFKMHGERYGWGGMFDSRDCSAMIMEIYRSFGVRMPRNSGQQGDAAGIAVDFPSDISTADREKILDNVVPGATLHMKGHVLLYLGKYNGRHYVFHDLASIGDADGEKNASSLLPRLSVNSVVVTELNLVRKTGISFLDSLYRAKAVDLY